MLNYLEKLTLRLATGVSELPAPVRQRHARFLKAAQREDGGFSGRDGGSDLYYTGFALRGLAVLGELHGPPAERAATFIKGRLLGRESIVDLISLVFGAALLDVSAGIDVFDGFSPGWRTALDQALENLRRPDGGYAKASEGTASSTYHTFLVTLCRQLIGVPLPQPEQAIEFIRGQAAQGGGFREIRASKRAGTNPTAAAIGVLKILEETAPDSAKVAASEDAVSDVIDDETRESTTDFLVEMQNDEGGLKANTRIPIADSLSTFTGSLTLADLGNLDEIDVAAARQYAASLEQSSGGFHGAAWDTACDVEYTFYGIGSLALLHGK